jgi:hypothetical protein
MKTKACSCGRTYNLEAGGDWARLDDPKIYTDDEGALCEQRTCAGCRSTLTIERVPALTVDELRKAVRTIDWMRESFNDKFTAQELLRLITVARECEWDLMPDQWTAAQCAEALAFGTVPRFEERPDGSLHALGVSDCHCRSCRREREEKEAAAYA